MWPDTGDAPGEAASGCGAIQVPGCKCVTTVRPFPRTLIGVLVRDAGETETLPAPSSSEAPLQLMARSPKPTPWGCKCTLGVCCEAAGATTVTVTSPAEGGLTGTGNSGGDPGLGCSGSGTSTGVDRSQGRSGGRNVASSGAGAGWRDGLAALGMALWAARPGSGADPARPPRPPVLLGERLAPEELSPGGDVSAFRGGPSLGEAMNGGDWPATFGDMLRALGAPPSAWGGAKCVGVLLPAVARFPAAVGVPPEIPDKRALATPPGCCCGVGTASCAKLMRCGDAFPTTRVPVLCGRRDAPSCAAPCSLKRRAGRPDAEPAGETSRASRPVGVVPAASVFGAPGCCNCCRAPGFASGARAPVSERPLMTRGIGSPASSLRSKPNSRGPTPRGWAQPDSGCTCIVLHKACTLRISNGVSSTNTASERSKLRSRIKRATTLPFEAPHLEQSGVER
mmetsp:Transcript_110730/g.319898  ORF Transcript_110730/g.319898 Transcript_110730/m.319898 type:complete len:453 (+) Transcript_110730:315-1673(+)